MSFAFKQSESVWPYTGAILAGGQSKRMGFRKESALLWDERPMIEHVLETLTSLCRQIVVLGECTGYQDFSVSNLCHLKDIHPGLGPVSGLESLLVSGIDSQYMVVSCDQPLLSQNLLRQLTETETPQLKFFIDAQENKLDPFPGIFTPAFLPCLQQAMRVGQYSIRKILGHYSSIQWILLDTHEQWQLQSINTLADLERINGHSPKEGRVES